MGLMKLSVFEAQLYFTLEIEKKALITTQVVEESSKLQLVRIISRAHSE